MDVELENCAQQDENLWIRDSGRVSWSCDEFGENLSRLLNVLDGAIDSGGSIGGLGSV